MNLEHKDFIGVYRNVYPEGYCQHLINEFERLVEGGAGWDRQTNENSPKHYKNDLSLGFNIKVHQTLAFQNRDVISVFFEGLQHCYDRYTEEFSVLKDAKIFSTHMKMQRTAPGGGYHVWHAEQSNRETERVLTYILYLNSLLPEEAGETEFLYQRFRIKPEENTLVIWPAAFTHAHRGNVVHGHKAKYIITGWFYYE